MGLLKQIQKLAAQKQVTPSQLALAWVLAKGSVAIPGTKRVKYIEENAAAANISLTTDEQQLLESIVPAGITAGNRYDEFSMNGVNL
jgi:aryl-alcohol dehydrogenase-like predicted oxidoreductase